MFNLFRRTRTRWGVLLLWLMTTAVPAATASSGGADTAQQATPSLDWPRFRGPNGAGVSDAAGFPVEFGPDLNVAWVTDVPFGRSSPIVVGDRIYLTASTEDALITMAFDRDTGTQLWRREATPARDDSVYSANDAASPTPAGDGDNVYVFFQELGLISYDTTGTERWRVEMGPYDNFYGIGASPVVTGDLVLMLCDQVAGSFLIAIDKDTGRERWRVERSGRLESWTTPVLYPSEQPESVLVFGSNWVDAYDLSNGEALWALPGVGAGPIASPVVTDSLLLLTSPNHVEGAPMPSYAQLAADADEDGDGTLNAVEFARIAVWGPHFGWVDRDSDGIAEQAEWEFVANLAGNSAHGTMAVTLPRASGAEGAEIIWSNEQSLPYIPSPLVYDGIVYLVRDGGIVQSLDLRTGEVFKRGRTSQSAGSVYASPVAADQKIIISTTEGEVAVLQAGKQWKVLAVNDLDEPVYASPALAGDRIFVRTPTRLYSFGTDRRDSR